MSTPSSNDILDASASPDLDSRSAIHDLVVGFYREIVNDELLGPVFDEVAEVDWPSHIPRLIDYWSRILLDEPVYNGSMAAAHREVHEIEAFRVEHFDRWFELWCDSIDSRWAGPYADRARAHAARTAGLLSRQLRNTDWVPR